MTMSKSEFKFPFDELAIEAGAKRLFDIAGRVVDDFVGEQVPGPSWEELDEEERKDFTSDAIAVLIEGWLSLIQRKVMTW